MADQTHTQNVDVTLVRSHGILSRTNAAADPAYAASVELFEVLLKVFIDLFDRAPTR